jgi:molybdopterin-guanine dinucleotide biosynthesis protein A
MTRSTRIDAASPTEYPPTPAVILAGGLARRIAGGDKLAGCAIS